MLGMYVHTCWSYNHPYAARTWTKTDWEGYLGGLAALGYDTLLICPMLEIIPVPPTASDTAYLASLRDAIDLAHDRFGMKFLVVVTPNIMPNAHSSTGEFLTRNLWDNIQYVDPGDDAAMAVFQQIRREQLRELARADGIVIIDSDPGGWPDSPPADFVECFRRQSEAMRAVNPDAEVYYWMWGGWPDNGHSATFTETLTLLDARVDGPWKALSCADIHRAALTRVGMMDRSAYYPYALVEYEPAFPMTNCKPDWFRQEMQRYDPALYPQGLVVNAQTHCLQLPYTYLTAHYARGGTYATENLQEFAQQLVRGTGGYLTSFGWRHLEEEWEFQLQRHYSAALRAEAAKDPQPGPLGGMLMMPPTQFLLDLADNLDLRADFIALRSAVDAGRKVKPALRQLLAHLKPYRDRLGYNHTSLRPLQQGLLDQLRRLDVPVLTAAVASTPAVPDGYLVHLIQAIEAYVG